MVWIVLGILALIIAGFFTRQRRADSARYMAEIAEFGLQEYHRDVVSEPDRERLMRRYSLFVGMLCVMQDMKRRGIGAISIPSNPLEERACQELARVGILKLNQNGPGYTRL